MRKAALVLPGGGVVASKADVASGLHVSSMMRRQNVASGAERRQVVTGSGISAWRQGVGAFQARVLKTCLQASGVYAPPRATALQFFAYSF